MKPDKETYCKIDELNLSLVADCRNGLHQEALAKYECVIENFSGEWRFPPIRITILDGVKYVLDGQHRLQAAKNKGLKKVPCEEKPMKDLDEAKRCALCANSQHGEKLTREELHNNIRLYLKHGGATTSDSGIAEIFGVSRTLVQKIRENADGMTKDEKLTKEIGDYIADKPEASIAEIARELNCSRKAVRTRISDLRNTEPAKKILCDCFGREIPQDHIPRLKNILNAIVEARCAVNGMREGLKGLINADAFANTQDAETFKAAIQQIDFVIDWLKPEALCTCRGDGCRVCGGVGFLTRKKFEMLVPESDR